MIHIKNIRPTEINAVRKTDFLRYVSVAIFVAMMSLTSCVKDELYDTPHPDKGVASVAIDFPQGAEGNYVIEIDGRPLADGKTASDPLTPGGHEVLAYNLPQGFTVEDGVARVGQMPVVASARASGGIVLPRPGYLYSGTKQITVMADDSLRVDLDVRQRVRDLHFELTVTEGDPERIVSVMGVLSGVAEAFDLRREALTGEAVMTAQEFVRTGDKVTADFRLLGTMGETQTIALQLTFSNGDTQAIESDLTEALAGFNGGTEPVTLTGNLRTPVKGGFTGSIDGWQQADGGDIDAH